MAESSKPWDGTVVGDAGPYDADTWREIAFYVLNSGEDDRGIFPNYLNELRVYVSAGPPDTVYVSTGGALVHGIYYYNDALYSEVVPTGAAGTYYAVLTKSFLAFAFCCQKSLISNPLAKLPSVNVAV